MHDDTDLSHHKPKTRRDTSGDRGVRAVTFGLGVAALAGLVATMGATATAANAACTDNGQPATIAAPLAPLCGPHITCSGT